MPPPSLAKVHCARSDTVYCPHLILPPFDSALTLKSQPQGSLFSLAQRGRPLRSFHIVTATDQDYRVRSSLIMICARHNKLHVPPSQSSQRTAFPRLQRRLLFHGYEKGNQPLLDGGIPVCERPRVEVRNFLLLLKKTLLWRWEIQNRFFQRLFLCQTTLSHCCLSLC